MVTQEQTQNGKKLLRYRDLVQRGLVNNRTTLGRWIRKRDFPPPLRLGPNTLAWEEGEVEAWLQACKAGAV